MSQIFSKNWWIASLIRALRTFCQTAVALIGTELVGFTELDWIHIASVAGVAAVLSILTSLAGLPEVKAEEGATNEEGN